MREILFRGKRSDNGNWIQGSLFVRIGEPYIIPLAIITSKAKVDHETVGQFTGRTDINGKKVFEHDILQLFTVLADGTREKAGKVAVQWCENDQCYVLITKEGHHYDDFGNYGRPEYYEVIGNIHDNPEMMEGGKK